MKYQIQKKKLTSLMSVEECQSVSGRWCHKNETRLKMLVQMWLKSVESQITHRYSYRWNGLLNLVDSNNIFCRIYLFWSHRLQVA